MDLLLDVEDELARRITGGPKAAGGESNYSHSPIASGIHPSPTPFYSRLPFRQKTHDGTEPAWKQASIQTACRVYSYNLRPVGQTRRSRLASRHTRVQLWGAMNGLYEQMNRALICSASLRFHRSRAASTTWP
jgi:hypothetical protein